MARLRIRIRTFWLYVKWRKILRKGESILAKHITGWWQLKHFWNFHPETWGRWTHFDEHIFQVGWNHHPDNVYMESPSVFAHLAFNLWQICWPIQHHLVDKIHTSRNVMQYRAWRMQTEEYVKSCPMMTSMTVGSDWKVRRLQCLKYQDTPHNWTVNLHVYFL